jgi:hypothetical protein
VWFLNQGWIALFRRYAAFLGEAALRRQNAPVGWLRNRKHDGTSARMRPLLLSGLLCVPAVVMLYFSWPHDRGGR